METKKILEQAQKIFETTVKDRRYLHSNPEIGNELPKTTEYVMKRLKEMGYEPKEIAQSAVVAVAGGKKPGKVFLIRGDMDALPMREQSGVDFASTCENAHTCGHDLHTAMLLSAAQLLKDNEDEIEGTVKLMFQPAEETLVGAQSMIDAGILENPKVDAAFGLHVFTDNPPGHLSYGRDYCLASSDSLVIKIKGVGCHGAMPYRGIDPINVAAKIHGDLQTLIAREINAMETAVITMGAFQAGTAMNIIPESAEMRGTLRTFNPEIREYLLTRIEEVCVNVAKAFRAEATFNVVSAVPSLKVDNDISDFLIKEFETIGSDDIVFHDDFKLMGSEDFACVSQIVPSTFFGLGAGPLDVSKRFGSHHPQILFNEDCFPYGVAAYVTMAINWLKENK